MYVYSCINDENHEAGDSLDFESNLGAFDLLKFSRLTVSNLKSPMLTFLVKRYDHSTFHIKWKN